MKNIHDKSKIEEIMDGKSFGYECEPDQIRWAMEEYGEFMREKTFKEIIAIIDKKGGVYCGADYMMSVLKANLTNLTPNKGE